MFRKTTSKETVQPRFSLALYQEFSVYIDACITRFVRLLERHPKSFLSGMVIMMLASAYLAFSFRPPKRNPVSAAAPVKGVRINGLGQVWQTAAKLKTAWDLRAQIDSLMKKQKLNARDTILLQRAFTAMEQLRIGRGQKSRITNLYPQPLNHESQLQKSQIYDPFDHIALSLLILLCLSK